MVEISAGLIIFGLALDIVGVILIFRFALPVGMGAKDKVIFSPKKDGGTETTAASVYQCWAKVGLGLLVLGFLFQAMGSAVVFWKEITAMTITQIGLLADIVGFTLLAVPGLFWTKTGIPFLPKVGEWKWWVLLIGVLLVVSGFVLQFLGTFE